MVSGTPTSGPSEIVPMSADRQEQEGQLHAEQHHDAGRGDLAGQLRQRVEPPAVVEHARAAQISPPATRTRDGLGVVERPLQCRQPACATRIAAATPRYMATPPTRGRGDGVHVPLARARPSSRSRMATIRTTGVVRKVTSARGEQDDGVLAHGIRRRGRRSGGPQGVLIRGTPAESVRRSPHYDLATLSVAPPPRAVPTDEPLTGLRGTLRAPLGDRRATASRAAAQSSSSGRRRAARRRRAPTRSTRGTAAGAVDDRAGASPPRGPPSR